MEAILEKQLSAERYTISRKPFYNWLSKNLPNFKEFSVLEIDSGSHELWESIYRNFTQSNITISNPIQSHLNKSKLRLDGYRINYDIEHSYNLSYDNDSMDLVISNNNNFIQNLNSIKEVNRVLKGKGLFINIVNGDNHITDLKSLFNTGRGIEVKVNPKHRIKYKYKELLKTFNKVNYREYTRTLKVTNANNILGYYLSNRNPKVREWALEDNNWILEEVNKIIKKNGYFPVEVNLGMFVCKI